MTSSSQSNPEEYEAEKVEFFNKEKQLPDETGYDCKECNNKELIAFLKNGRMVFKQCECVKIRKNIRDMSRSGLGKMNDKTLENYQDIEEWQTNIKAKATAFLKEPVGKWFFIGGQSGAGKTHIAKAITADFVQNGYSAKYLAWRKEVQRLNANINDDGGIKMLDEIYSASVLFIDDFLKSSNNAPPSQGELNRAIDIIMARYEQKDNITIISSERTIGEIINFDQATGGRIAERAEGYVLNIASDIKKNYRLKSLNL